jgi:carnitine-CoA ligase
MTVPGGEFAYATIGEMVAERAGLGAKPFLWIDGECLTYAQAHDRSASFANGLLDLGVRHGDVVATFMHNSLDGVCLWFALARLGAIRAGVNVSLRESDLAYTLRDCTASVLVIEEELLGSYLPLRGTVGVTREILAGSRETASALGMIHLSALAAAPPADPGVTVRADDPAGIVYTGGSTGMPKGVLVSHRYHMAFGGRYREVAQPQAADVMYDCGHLFHLAQLGVIGPMYVGITSVMSRWFSVGGIWDVINRHGVTLVHLPGTMLGPIVERTPPHGGPDHQVRLGIGIATAQIRRSVREAFESRFGFPLLEVYAQSEMGALLCSERVQARRRGSSGQAYGWAEIQIVDEFDRPVPAGTEGEIVTRPTRPGTFMIGYFNKPEATCEAWRNLWHHTGDIGFMDEDGYLYVKGRKAHWVRRRGENISALEVEHVIDQHPRVAASAVVGVPAELGDEDVKVYVVTAAGEPLEEAEIVAWCSGRLAYFKVPRYVEFVTDLPRTATKRDIQRNVLRARGIGCAWDRDAAAPRR